MFGNAVPSSGDDRLSFILIIEEPGDSLCDFPRAGYVNEDSRVAVRENPGHPSGVRAAYDRYSCMHRFKQ